VKKRFLLTLLIVGLFGGMWSCVPVNQLSNDEFLLYKQRIITNSKVSKEELLPFFRQKPNRRILNLPITPYLYAYYKGEKKWLRHLHQDSTRYQAVEHKYDSLIKVKQDSLATLGFHQETDFGEYDLRQNPDAMILYRKLQKLIKKKNDKLSKIQTKISGGNWLMRVVGEKPVIFDTVLSRTTAEQMQKYLEFKKGLFGSSVIVKWDTLGKKKTLKHLKSDPLKINLNVGSKLIAQTFYIQESTPSYVREISWQVEDSATRHLITSLKTHILQKGKPYNEQLLEQERDYLTKILRDNGYFNFYKNQIRFKVDTFTNNHPDSLDIITVITLPNNTAKTYSVDTVIMDTDADAMKSRDVRRIKRFNNITYVLHRERFATRVLDTKIFIRPHALFSQYYTEETQKALAAIDMFKFVNIKFDTLGGKFRANIFTSPFKKYSLTTELGLNVTQTLPGPFASLSFKNRNLLRSCDVFDITLRYSVEAQAAATDVGTNLLTRSAGIIGSWSFPWIMLPLGGKIKKTLSLKLPQTIITAGYNMVERPEYTRENLVGAINYKWRNNRNGFWTFGLLDVAVVQTPFVSKAFQERLDELTRLGNPLQRSFDNAIITNTNVGYSFSRNVGLISMEKLSYTKIYVETGGFYLNILNATELSQNKGKLLGLQTYRYYKTNVEFRKLLNTGKKARLAMRFNAGYAIPYGTSAAVLPYEKLFFAGGSNSIRAWTARRVGPGSFSPPQRADGTYDYRFEQGGDILAEYSVELRHPLFAFVEGAPFVDAGNIWTIKKDEARPGANFELERFWKEIAIGLGYGIRFNFNILIVRFDFAMKIYEPARPLGNRFIVNKITTQKPFGQPEQMLINIGIGYPF